MKLLASNEIKIESSGKREINWQKFEAGFILQSFHSFIIHSVNYFFIQQLQHLSLKKVKPNLKDADFRFLLTAGFTHSFSCFISFLRINSNLTRQA